MGRPRVLVKRLAVVFAVEFGDGVRAGWFGACLLALGDGGVVAVDGGGAAEDEFFDSGTGRFLEDEQGADGVGLDAADRVLDGFGYRDHGGEVEHEIDAVHGGAECGAVKDRAADEIAIESGEV